ncbi:MAG: hypothetical protein AAF411_29310, partial [Myxococcota bacterium]
LRIVFIRPGMLIAGTLFLGPTYVIEGVFEDARSIHLSLGATAVFGYKVTRGFELFLGYRFQFVRDAIEGRFATPDSNLSLHMPFVGVGAAF